MEQKFSALGINLEDFDAVGEMLFPPVVTIDDFYRPKVGKTYHVQVLLPDERRFLLDEALNHLQGVPSGSVTGEIVEFIVDGAPVVDLGNWSNYYHAIKRGSCIVRDEDRTLSLRSSPAHEHTQAERKIEQKSTFE